MHDSSAPELELTPDLLEYAKAVALKEAQKLCPPHVDYDDAVSDARLHLISKPPKHDPARGVSPKTLIYTVVQRAVLKYVGRECRHAGRFKQVVRTKTGDDDDREEALDALARGEEVNRRQRNLLADDRPPEDIFEFIDNEDSRALCRLFIECDGNVSEVARRMNLSEGAIRYRLTMLRPRLVAAGFDPFFKEE